VVDPSTPVEILGQQVTSVSPLPNVQLELSGLPKTAALGALGVPGLAAYLGLFQTCKYDKLI